MLEQFNGQVQFDCFGMLYAELSAALLRWDRAQGERVIRQGVEEYARKKGEQLRLHQAEGGMGIHLQNLFAAQPCCGSDERFDRLSLRDEKQAQLLEVHSCPLAKLWAARDGSFAGSLYCEEYAHGLMKGYTGGVGQANVSNALTYPRDHCCTMSFYYRLANMTPRQQEEFAQGGTAVCEPHVWENMLGLYRGLLRAAERQGPEAAEALHQGLDAFLTGLRRELPRQKERMDPDVDVDSVAEEMRAAFGQQE